MTAFSSHRLLPFSIMPLRYQPNYALHLVLLFFLSALPYLGTTNHSWHLDDPPNILHNVPLHIDDLHPNSLVRSFFAHPTATGTLFRPVANFSFALNWFFGRDHVHGYHLVNITIHCLTALILYFCCLLLLQSPTIKERYRTYRADISLLTASLWALAPIHTQAVTYIVQRMAQLAALFTVSSILFYLLFRLSSNKSKRFLFLLSFLCSTCLALGSKENSILLPISLLLIECVFFSQIQPILSAIKRNKFKSLVVLLVALSVTAVTGGHYIVSLLSYDHRSFTMIERLLTEARILFLYLSQIFFPAASRLSIEHDIVISNSIFSPWTTLPSVIACMGLIIFGIYRMRQNPLLSFAILFFFLNHLVESTIIPLELIFEHRNYLPSFFLFLPIAAFVVSVATKIGSRKKFLTLRSILAASCTGFLIVSGISTFERNKAWASENSIWEDAVTKAPESGRAKLNLALSYIHLNRHQIALQLCNQAELLTAATNNKIVPISLNLKSIIAYKEGDYTSALDYLEQALILRNDYTDAAYTLIDQLIKLGRYEEALNVVSKRYDETGKPELMLIKGILFLHLKRPVESLRAFQESHVFFPTSTTVLAGQGKAMSMLGYHKKADSILSFAAAAGQPGAQFLRIENYLRWGEQFKATQMIEKLIQSIPLNTLLHQLEEPPVGTFIIPCDNLPLKKKLFAILQMNPPIPSTN